MRLMLIRHGQTPSNVLGLLDTALPGPGLTDLGAEQAAAVPEVLAGEPIEVVYASAARRAQLTAAPLAVALGVGVVVREGLREVAAGDWEMRSDDASVQGYLGVLGSWLAGDLDTRTPGPTGESGREVLQRFDEVIAEVGMSGAACAAVVAHGAVNRLWASSRADNLDDEFGAAHSLRNTGIVVLTGHPGQGWIAESWTGAEFGDPVGEVGEVGEVGAAGASGSSGSADGPEDPFDDPIPVPEHP